MGTVESGIVSGKYMCVLTNSDCDRIPYRCHSASFLNFESPRLELQLVLETQISPIKASTAVVKRAEIEFLQFSTFLRFSNLPGKLKIRAGVFSFFFSQLFFHAVAVCN